MTDQYLTCSRCGKEFTHWNRHKIYCPECSENRTKSHNKKREPLTFAEISHIGKVYYKLNNKLLSYGEIVSLIDLHPKRCVCCNAYTGSKHKPLCDKCGSL